jgi:hypothetical protein
MKHLWITLLLLLEVFAVAVVTSKVKKITGTSVQLGSADINTNDSSLASPTAISKSTSAPSTSPTPTSTNTRAAIESTEEVSTSTTVSTPTTQKEVSTTPEVTTSTGNPTTTIPSTSPTVTSPSKAEVTAAPATSSGIPPTTTTGDFLLAGVKISETNILLTDSDSDSYFVEMQIKSDIDSVWLVIIDANKTIKEEALVKQQYNVTKNITGVPTYFMNNETKSWDKLRNLESVLIALYANENTADSLTMSGLYDILLYSSYGNINAGLVEEYANQNLIIDHNQLKDLHGISLSRCSPDKTANIATVLTYESPGEANQCNLTINRSLEMKLTKTETDKDCSSDLTDNFRETLARNVITGVNTKKHCGFAFPMLRDMNITKLCPTSKEKEIQIEFTVSSAFPNQLNLIMSGYKNFVSQTKLQLGGEIYDLSSCYQNCFPKEAPLPTKSADNRVRVTVTVVISCITVFLLVVLFLFLYMRRKKKGVLQFSMARLDEDDAFIGDMDDFVGNQGPTFRNFK